MVNFKTQEKTHNLVKPRKILVCTAWPYVHAVPHFGNIIPFLSADAIARYHRIVGDEVEFVSGSDEHGARMELESRKLGITPKQLVDNNHAFVQKVNKFLNISFTNYSRTSSMEHREFVQDFYKTVYDNGHIEIKDEELPYCSKCDLFLPDKFVQGDCPHCQEKNIQGDQCDNCGRVLEPLELINPRCIQCGTKPSIRKTKTAYFDLPKFTEELKKYVSEKKDWQPRVKAFTERWFEEGLLERPVTRDLEWGIPAPFPGMQGKVIYCWAEAVLGYVSTVSTLGKLDDFWKGDAKSYFCLGKDNIPFHTILFPALLLAHGNYNLPTQIVNNEYLNFEGKQFSKSRGVGVYTDDVIDILNGDYWRFYLFRIFPQNKDTDFAWKDFSEKINSELVANVANFVNRVLSLIDKFYSGKVPKDEIDPEIKKKLEEGILNYRDHFEKSKIKEPLEQALAISSLGNEYLQHQEPWKNDANKGCLSTCVAICRVFSVLLEPYIPEASAKLREIFGVKKLSFDDLFDLPSKVGDKTHLFEKIDVEEIQKRIHERKSLSSFKKLDLRVGKILEVKEHPKADRLFIEKVDLGDREVTIVSGLRKHYLAEELVGKKVVIVTNLKPAELRGVVSEGMLLAASKRDKLGVLYLKDAEAGDRVFLEGVDSEPSEELTIDEFAKVHLTTGNGKIVYGEHILRTENEEVSVEKVEDGAKVS
jgi:methionyl-tRNA synthetase